MVHELIITQDWECDGALRMENAKTIETYKRIKEKRVIKKDFAEYEMFVAFTKEKFAEGLAEIGKTEKDIMSLGGGVFGTPEGYQRFRADNTNRMADVKKFCDPQEVYCHEWNNNECMYDHDGDMQAMLCVIKLFGLKAARALKHRYRDYYTVSEILEKK